MGLWGFSYHLYTPKSPFLSTARASQVYRDTLIGIAMPQWSLCRGNPWWLSAMQINELAIWINATMRSSRVPTRGTPTRRFTMENNETTMNATNVIAVSRQSLHVPATEISESALNIASCPGNRVWLRAMFPRGCAAR